MQCRQCGTEIADKAIVCFRCGAGTTDPVRKAVPITPQRSPLVPVVIVLVLVLAAVFLGYLSRSAANPEPLQIGAGLTLGAAIAVLLTRVLRR